MDKFLSAYNLLCFVEYDDIKPLALEYAKGENFMTYKGINRRDEPNFSGWHIIDSHISNNLDDIQHASIDCCLDYDLEYLVTSYYRKNNFDSLKCDLFPQSVVNRLFVHSALIGVPTCIKLAQITAGCSPDGSIGKTTISHINQISSFSDDFDLILGIYLKNKTIAVPSLAFNLDGWNNRILKVKNAK